MSTAIAPNAKRLILITIATLCILLMSLIFTLKRALAGSGLVATVGGATFIQGAQHFWVTSTKPTFSGVTTAGSKVSGTVGSQSVSATADASGNWSWTPTKELSGDNPVTITSGATTATFTLTIGVLPANIASASASSLPPGGTNSPTAILFAGGLVLALIGTWRIFRSFSDFD